MATFSSLILLFPFLIFFVSAISTHAASAPEEVRDTTGRILHSGVDYYILPVFHGRGGGLTLGPKRKQTCPSDVVQDFHNIHSGLPLTFHLVNPKKGVVRVSTDLNIKFSYGTTTCTPTAVWKLAGYDKEVKQYFVSTGGQEGNPGPKTLSNWFKIEKFNEDYKLSYCPSVCKSCKVICKDIGIYVDNNGMRRLALSDNPFRVMFKKA